MEKCYKIENLYTNERGAYGLRNSYCLPFLSFLGEYFDSRDILVFQENLLEMTSKEIIEKYDLSEKDLENILKRYVISGIKNGATEMNIVSLSPTVTKRVLEELGVGGKALIRAKDIEVIPKIYKEFGGLLGVAVDPYIDGDDLTNEVSEVCGKYKLPVYVTLYNDLEKTGMLNSLFNKPPINYIEDVGLLDRECYIYGGICADKDDFSVMASYGAKVIVSPYDFLNLGQGIANICAMQGSDVTVQLASPINNDIIEEIRLAGALNRGLLSDCEVLSASEVLELALSKKERIKLAGDYSLVYEECEKIMERIKEKI